MKYFLTLSLILVSYLGFSQEIIVESNTTNPVQALNYPDFDNVYDRLKAISTNINETLVVIDRLDEMRQGQLIINTTNIGKSFEGVTLDIRPSLDIELQNVMYTGTFLNPNGNNRINFKK